MRYPIFSNWIKYKKIPDEDAYLIRDCFDELEYVVNGDTFRFAKQFDGKTDPYKIWPELSRKEVRRLIRALDKIGLIRLDHGVISKGFLNYTRTLVIPKNGRRERRRSKIMNFMLMIMFIPVFIAGIFVYGKAGQDYSRYSYAYRLWMQYPEAFSLIFTYLGAAIGLVFHEMCHGNASRAYGGRVLEYGFQFRLIPALYTMEEHKKLQSRLKKIQILAAGVEGNIFVAGIFLMLTGVFPNIGIVFLFAGFANIMLAVLNLMVADGTDGSRIIMMLIGMDDEYGMEMPKAILLSPYARRDVLGEGITGLVKLIVCVMLLIMRYIFALMCIINVIIVIGSFIV